MKEDAVEVVHLRNDFYRDNYRKVLGALLVLVIAVAVLVNMTWYMFTHRPKPEYFATRADGSVVRLIPLSVPYLRTPAVLQWAADAAVTAFTFNFVDYRKQLQAAQAYFTPEGWREFLNALKQSNNLATIEAKKLIVSAVVTGAPVVLRQGVLERGRYGWRVQMPMTITYQGASEKVNQKILLTLVIMRVPTLEAPQGIGIDQWVAGPA